MVQAINNARKSVEIVIFRFDRSEVEKALASAVSRGVFVHALIAHTNRWRAALTTWRAIAASL
jgi:phosphatidylserine/phosphatidylglycerophosphate/cardiolipin synthase-like enzyme